MDIIGVKKYSISILERYGADEIIFISTNSIDFLVEFRTSFLTEFLEILWLDNKCRNPSME